MDNDVEVPDLRFWGLVVHAGKPATYSIQNEHGLLELCHVTNVALQSERTSSGPVYVRIRSPDEPDKEYTLGALIPGKLYSFSTDLMISPDTVFSHTGVGSDQVHLTGYRCAADPAHGGLARCHHAAGFACAALCLRRQAAQQRRGCGRNPTSKDTACAPAQMHIDFSQGVACTT